MGLLTRLRGRPRGIRIRCGMCRVVTDYPEAARGTFVVHSCDSDLLVRERDLGAEEEALDLFVRWFARGPLGEEERIAARDRLLYALGEGPIPGLEDLLWRLKYDLREPFPPPEIAARLGPGEQPPRIDWSNELEMILHRQKKYAITVRACAAAGPETRPILLEKLERLQRQELVPLEED